MNLHPVSPLRWIGPVVAVFVLLLASPFGQAQTVEWAMRQAQARRVAVGVGVVEWPRIFPTDPAPPAYPPDGFYDSTDRVAAVAKLEDALWGGTGVSDNLYSRFYDQGRIGTFLAGSGPSTDVIAYSNAAGSFGPKPTDAVTVANVAVRLTAAIAKLDLLDWEHESSTGHPAGIGWIETRISTKLVNKCWLIPAGYISPSPCVCCGSNGVAGNCYSPQCTDAARAKGEEALAAAPWIAGAWQGGFNRITSTGTLTTGVVCEGTSRAGCEGATAAIDSYWFADGSVSRAEYRMDLSAFCGDVYVYIRLDGPGSGTFGGTQTGTNTYEWQVVPGGSSASFGGEQDFNTTVGMTDKLLLYRGCYDRIEEEIDDLLGTFHAAIGPLDGELTDDELRELDCPPPAGTPYPYTDSPVGLATGDKFETATDLVVSVPGTDFTFTREYTSDTDNALVTGPGLAGVLIGRGWSSNCFRFLKDTPTSLQLGGPPMGTTQAFFYDSVTDKHYPTRGATQHITSASASIGGQNWPVWRFTEPGEWTREFVRDAFNPGDPRSALVGMLLREIDPYGNTRFYSYHLSASSPRLHVIYINGYPGDLWCDAQIKFIWDAGTGSPTKGLLKSIRVRRPRWDGFGSKKASAYAVVQSVDYTYAAGVSSLHPDVGSELDLVQVTYREQMHGVDLPAEAGPTNAQWVKITQYRYHDGDAAPDAFGVVGQPHQIKAVIDPEQVEFFAQKWNANRAHDVRAAVTSAASVLLGTADGDVVSGSGLSPRDLFAKAIGYEPDTPHRVVRQYLLTACACGAGAPGRRHDYSYFDYQIGATPASTARVREFEILDSAGNTRLHRTMYHDMVERSLVAGRPAVPYEVRRVIVEPSPGSRAWVWEYQHDSKGRISEEATPSEFLAYTPADATTPPSPPSRTVRSGFAGLVHRYTYQPTASGDPFLDSDRLTSTSVRRQGSAIFDPVVEIDYALAAERYLPTEIRRFVGGVHPAEVTTFNYLAHATVPGGPLGNIAWIEIASSLEATVENGPSNVTTAKSVSLFNTQGLLKFLVDAEGKVTQFDYDGGLDRMMLSTGEPTDRQEALSIDPSTIDNAIGASGLTLPTGSTNWGTNSPGSADVQSNPALSSSIQLGDALGRRIQRTTDNASGEYSGGTTVYQSWILGEDPLRPGVLYRQIRELSGFRSEDGSSTAPLSTASPVAITWVNAAGKTLRSSTFAADTKENRGQWPASGSYDARPKPLLPVNILTEASTGPAELSRMVSEYDVSGLLKFSRQWADVAANLFEQTEFRYDNLGRTFETVAPSGTVTRISSRDALDRVLSVEVGVGPYSASSYAQVNEFFYDDPDLSDGPHQGVGNGNQTWEIRHVGEGPGSGKRTVRRRFDHRDRLTGVATDDAPFEVFAYDRQSRVVERAVFSPAWLGSVPDLPATPDASGDLSRRGFYEQVEFSARGLPFRSRRAVDPTIASPTWLATDRWYDRKGRVVALATPGAPVIKTVFDGADRIIKQFTSTDRPPTSYAMSLRSTDGLPGANGVANDRVLEQSEYEYRSVNGSGRPFKRRLHQTIRRQRLHDAIATATGDLSSQSHIAQVSVRLYDPFGRLAAVADLGTNVEAHTDLQEDGVSAVPNFSGVNVTVLTPEDDLNATDLQPNDLEHEHFVRYDYNERGVVDRVRVLQSDTASGNGTPVYHTTRTLYDDLGRSVLTIEGYDDGQFTGLDAAPFRRAFDWGTPHGFRQPVPRWGTSTPDRNRATATVYDTAGRLSHRIAFNNIDGVITEQITQYDYGTIIESGASATHSLIASNDLVSRVRYPRAVDGLPGSSADDQVAFGYNRLGEVRGSSNQNGTTHQFGRDGAGRSISDAITAFGSTGQATGVDNTIERIVRTFDAFGRLSTVRSLGSGSTVRDAVKFEYTPLWQVAAVVQDIDSDVPPAAPTGTAPRTVGYQYDTQASPSGNFSRLHRIVYPDGSPLEYTYPAGIDASISRPTRLKLEVDGVAGLDEIATYAHLGLDSIAQVGLPRPQVTLDRSISAVGVRNTGVYPGWDRYGRLKYQVWNLDATAHDSTLNRATHPPIVAESYELDPASKITNKINLIPGLTAQHGGADTDWDYSYDKLDRLQTAIRGQFDATTGAVQPYFAGSRQWLHDSLGNWRSSNTDKTLAPADGDFNDAGEVAVGAFSSDNELQSQDGVSYVYDHAGNRLAQTQGSLTKYYQYDAWNRLVKVWSNDGSSTVDIARYQYNGQHWRSQKIVNTSSLQGSGTGLTQRREMYYSADWQLLEERIDDDWPGDEGTSTIDRVAQQVWGLAGIDEPILRREDRPFSETPGQPELAARAADGVFDQTWYYLTDHQGSVIALIDDEAPLPYSPARVVNRASYEPHGSARFHARADVNRSGGITVEDNFDFLATYFAAELAADHNFSGTVTVQDIFDFLADFFTDQSDLPVPRPGAVSRPYKPLSAADEGSSWRYPDSVVGYCGYLFNPETGQYCVRHRVLDSVTGRWLQRDPAGYVDGMNLYEYVGSSPLMGFDPMGLDDEGVAHYRSQIALGNGQEAAKIYARHLTPAERAQIDSELASDLARYRRAEVHNRAAASIARSVRNTAAGTAVVIGAIIAAPVVLPATAVSALGTAATGIATPLAGWSGYQTGQDLAELTSGREVSGWHIGRDLSAGERADRAGSVVDAGLILSGSALFGPRRATTRCDEMPKISGPGLDGPPSSPSVEISGPGLDGPIGGSWSRISGPGVDRWIPNGTLPPRPSGIPKSWLEKPSKGDGGAIFYDPTNKGHAVRVMPGNPESQYPNSRAPYVRWTRHGQHLDSQGRAGPYNSPETHIPYNDFVFNAGMYSQ